MGNDISQLFVSVVLSYYAGKGHRPRWIALGVYTVVAFCLMNALPHFLYGPGLDALSLTVEHGGVSDGNMTAAIIGNNDRYIMNGLPRHKIATFWIGLFVTSVPKCG